MSLCAIIHYACCSFLQKYKFNKKIIAYFLKIIEKYKIFEKSQNFSSFLAFNRSLKPAAFLMDCSFT